MKLVDYFRTLKSPELRTGWAIAVAADAIQLAAVPLFAVGGISPADAVLDVIVGFVLTRLLGWHWAFLPSLIAEVVPGMDLFPTWTAAVLYVTHERVQLNREAESNEHVRSAEPEILPPDPNFSL